MSFAKFSLQRQLVACRSGTKDVPPQYWDECVMSLEWDRVGGYVPSAFKILNYITLFRG